MKKPILIEGNPYPSIVAACNAYNTVAITTVYARICKGWSLEKAIITPSDRATPSKDHKGIEYKTFADMCRAYDLNKQTVNSRLDHGWSIEEALTTKAREYTYTEHNKRAHSITVAGVKYRSIRLACKAHNKSTALVAYRVQIKGMTYEEAILSPMVKKHECQDHKGNYYKDFSTMAKAYGKTAQLVRDRMKQGFTLKRALTQPIRAWML